MGRTCPPKAMGTEINEISAPGAGRPCQSCQVDMKRPLGSSHVCTSEGWKDERQSGPRPSCDLCHWPLWTCQDAYICIWTRICICNGPEPRHAEDGWGGVAWAEGVVAMQRWNQPWSATAAPWHKATPHPAPLCCPVPTRGLWLLAAHRLPSSRSQGPCMWQLAMAPASLAHYKKWDATANENNSWDTMSVRRGPHPAIKNGVYSAWPGGGRGGDSRVDTMGWGLG